MNVMLFGCSYLGSYNAMRTFEVWRRVAVANQGVTVFDVRTASGAMDAVPSPSYSEQFIHTIMLRDNIGHGSRLGDQDGWGRAFCEGIQAAIADKMDWVVHMEGDLICRLDARSVINHLVKLGKPFGAPWCQQVSALETGLMYMNVNRLKEINFIERYNWRKITPAMGITERIERQPERVIKGIMGDECAVLRISGERWENDESSAMHNLANHQYLTHCRHEWASLFALDADGQAKPLISMP